MTAPILSRLTRRDYALLALFSLALFAIAPLFGRLLSGHESVQPQTAREMYQGGSWLVPTIGGDPWLERPPVPMWLICGVYALAGTPASDTAARFAAVIAAVPIVLLIAGIGARLYGRGAGIAAGLIYATMHEVYSYSSNPEADIFLALIVTAVIAVFVKLEFGREGSVPPSLSENGVRGSGDSEPAGFFAARSWLVILFFALLGATNLAKGVIFGTAMAAIPVVGYLLWNRSRVQIKRYFWFWGFLIAAVVALVWPAMVVGQHPEILQLWKEHYFGRLNKGYLREPWWYYAAYVLYVILPWTIPALVGLWSTRKAAFAGPGPARFLWCWAILPPAIFSLSDGKHHHYLLQCIGPWAILSVLGAKAIWQFHRERAPRWLQDPLILTAACGVVAVALLVAFGSRIPGGRPIVIAAGVFVPLAAFTIVRTLASPSARVAFGGVLATTVAAYAIWTPYQAAYIEEYSEDLVLVREASSAVPAEEPVYVQWDWIGPLETFWVLYHSPRPGMLIRDPWQLADRAAGRDHAYILARRWDAQVLKSVGTVEPVLESAYTRLEKKPEQRRVLYKVTFGKTIPPAPAEYISLTRRPLW